MILSTFCIRNGVGLLFSCNVSAVIPFTNLLCKIKARFDKMGNSATYISL